MVLKHTTMCPTLALDDDVFALARQKSQRDHVSLGTAVSELMRQGIRSLQQAAMRRPAPRSKYAVLPAIDEIITSEHVYKLVEQEGI